MGTVLAHDLTQLAAALTYYTVLSLLPALIVVVSLLGIVGLSPDTVHSLLDTLGELGAPWAAQLVSDVLDSVLTSQNSGIVLIVSLVAALWAASAYVGSFMAASDRIYEIAQRRPFWKSLPLRVGLALLLLVLLSVTAAVVALVGPFGRWVVDVTRHRLGAAAPVDVDQVAAPHRARAAALHAAVQVHAEPAPAAALVAAPRRRRRASPSGSPPPPASASTSTTSRSYNRVYGTLGAAVAFLVWAWLMNLALLVGVEVNRDLERRRTRRPSEQAASPEEAASV